MLFSLVSQWTFWQKNTTGNEVHLCMKATSIEYSSQFSHDLWLSTLKFGKSTKTLLIWTCRMIEEWTASPAVRSVWTDPLDFFCFPRLTVVHRTCYAYRWTITTPGCRQYSCGMGAMSVIVETGDSNNLTLKRHKFVEKESSKHLSHLGFVLGHPATSLCI